MPFSSFVHNTTRTVRLGRRPSLSISRAASHAARQPPPSSIAPCPTSHESMWPLTMTISSGFSRPGISAMTFREMPSGSVRASIFNRTRIVSPRAAMRVSILASSSDRAACGIFLTALAYDMPPVCGVCIENGPTDRIKLATAPARAAWIAPCVRTITVWRYSVNGTLNRTIFPTASAARCLRSSNPLTTSTSAVMPSGGVPTLPPKPSIGKSRRRGESNSTDSLPRTQRGTVTSSPRTFWKPSFFISARHQSMASSRFFEPVKRGPNVSHIVAKRENPNTLFVAACVNRCASG